MRLLLNWIALVTILACLSFKALSQDSIYVKLVFKGDIVELDTGVLVSLETYRNVRTMLALYEAGDSLSVAISAGDEAIIMEVEAKTKHLQQVIDELYVMLARRDELIGDLSESFKRMEATNAETLESYNQFVDDNKKLWKKPTTWVTLCVGIAIGVFVAK